MNRCPCRRLALLVLEKRLQGKGRRQAPGAHWLLCYYPEREEGGASEQLMAVCDKSVYIQKSWGLGRPGADNQAKESLCSQGQGVLGQQETDPDPVGSRHSAVLWCLGTRPEPTF